MSPATVAQQYKDNQIISASASETVLMLYDGIIRFLGSAIINIEKGDIPEKANLIIKVVNIIDYLQSCLDKERGGEIAENLNRLYEYMLVELTQANLKNDANKINDVMKLIKPIRDAWAEICKESSNENGKANQWAAAGGLKANYAKTANEAQPVKRVAVKI